MTTLNIIFFPCCLPLVFYISIYFWFPIAHFGMSCTKLGQHTRLRTVTALWENVEEIGWVGIIYLFSTISVNLTFTQIKSGNLSIDVANFQALKHHSKHHIPIVLPQWVGNLSSSLMIKQSKRINCVELWTLSHETLSQFFNLQLILRNQHE